MYNPLKFKASQSIFICLLLFTDDIGLLISAIYGATMTIMHTKLNY